MAKQEEIEATEEEEVTVPVGFVTESAKPLFNKSTITFNEGATAGGDDILDADWRNKPKFVIDICNEGKLYTSTLTTITIDGIVVKYYGYFRHHVGRDVKHLLINISDTADRVGQITIRYLGTYFASTTSGAAAALPEIAVQKG